MNVRSSLRLLALATVFGMGACNMADREPAANDQSVTVALPPAEAAPPEKQDATARLDGLEAEAEAETGNAVAPDPNLVTRAWFAGRWSDTGDCADAGEFAPNGTYRLADGTRGMWNVQDGRLVVQHAEGRAVVGLRRVDDGTVETVNGDGSVGRSIRC